MATATATGTVDQAPKGLGLLKTALRNRKTAIMLVFGFAAGLPYTLLIGTLNAWLGEWEIDLATIGVVSWIGLAYAFKFLWSPLVDRVRLPVLERFGRRRSWLFVCQVLLTATFFGLAMSDPRLALGWFAQAPGLSPEWRLFVVTGLLGGLTTFSTFSAETVQMLLRQQYAWAGTTVALHVFGSFSMTVLGMATLRALRAAAA